MAKKNVVNATDVALESAGLPASLTQKNETDFQYEEANTANMSLPEQLREFSKDNVSELCFSMGDEKFNLELITVEHYDIQTATIVHLENGRDQDWLTKIGLGKLITKIQLRGQLFPALGFWGKNSKDEVVIFVVDGSRRRSACVFAKQLFKIYVSDKPLSDGHVALLTDEANEHKKESLAERGAKWAAINEELKLSLRALAVEVGENKDTVSRGLIAHSIPKELMNTFPSPSDLGWNIIKVLNKIVKVLTAKQLDKLIAQIREETDYSDLSHTDEPIALNIKHKDVVKLIAHFINKNTASKSNCDTENLLGDKSVGTITVLKSGALDISLKQVNPESIADLISRLEEYK
ncbi:hypothetical protein [Psychromonas aquimarina]|uniref:hypothetical protein n=1 Tax=Psychromonas aquimarina TaxID=444919 RepID=UPI0003F722B0|nr:hypothetical protein [Psychromonas aquimarina]